MSVEFVVADASVLLKWYLQEGEPCRAQALLLFGRFRSGEVRILLPELALFELGNRLVRIPDSGLQYVSDILDLLTDAVPLDPGDLKQMAECLAGLHCSGMRGITMYDCAYIYIARITGSVLITADSLQAEAARRLDVRCTPIADYR